MQGKYMLKQKKVAALKERVFLRASCHH